MAINQRLELRQSQTLTITPQLRQSLEILQLSSIELNSYLSAELEKNPLLSKDEQTEEQTGEEGEEREETATPEKEEADSISGLANETWENEDKEAQDNIYSEEGYTTSTPSRNFSDDMGYEQNISKEKTLREHIQDQINYDIHDNVKKIIAVHLLDMMDEAGYLVGDLKALAELLSCEVSQIEEVIESLQKFDPPGIFARSLNQCLAIQLKEKDRFDPAMQKLIENLELLAKNESAKLMKICGVGEADLKQMIKEIKELNPKPGSTFASETVQVIQPDIFLRKNPKGGWSIELNNDALPKILVNKKYYTEVLGKTRNKVEKKYLTEQLSNANWLVKALNQRAETMLKVASELVTQQNDFFEKGIMHLKPLILKNVAEKVGLHESTISRVVNNKFMATGKGLYELKYFFSSSLHSADGNDISSESIKHLIKEIVGGEPAEKPFSDDRIVDILKEKGVEIARRTVTKYREALKIPSSPERKRKI